MYANLMKSSIANNNYLREHPFLPKQKGYLFFWVAIALHGIPFQSDLTSVTTLGIENTIIPAVIWGTLYVGSFLFFLFTFRTSLKLFLSQWPLLLLLIFIPISALWALYPH